MDKNQAKELIKETFEKPFEKNKFSRFIKELLNSYDEAKKFNKPLTGTYIKESFRDFIKSFDRIGRYHDGDNIIDILIVYLNRETSIDRARTTQRNFIAGYLKGDYGSTSWKDAALVAFVSPNTDDWRFSLVKMDHLFEQTESGKSRVKEEFTPARRWSFLVGTHEKSHTAQVRLVPVLINEKNPSLSELMEAFSIEIVTKEFFKEYRNLFLETKKALDTTINSNSKAKADFAIKGIDTVDFSKKLLGQIVFIYFLQKKGWFGVKTHDKWGTGPKDFINQLFLKKYGNYSNFFDKILEPFFYDALARERDNDLYKPFQCRIPFLNGGLFDPINNYDWKNTNILLPNELFSNSNRTKEGDIGDGILDVFNRYNFTVKEDEPLDKEVAVDPELLGKAYEKFNAIRSDNYEDFQKALKSGEKKAENKFNKQYGVYYTPREIVHYMCSQSLKAYVLNLFPGVSSLFENNTDKKSYNFDELERIKESILNIRACDPACGSGAFLLGMLSEMIHFIQKINGIQKNQSFEEVSKDKNTEYTLLIKKDDCLIYKPCPELVIKCRYIGGMRFEITINNELKGELLSHDMALYLKAFINDFNRKQGKKTIANIFSQGRINDGKTFNVLRSEKDIKYIVDNNKNIIWAYKDYKTEGKTRPWRMEEDNTDEHINENALVIEENFDQYLYHLKAEIIKNCLFGVDIDPGAVEIAKLRLWLSLAVDYEGDEIEPLPNLDYRIMQGNSLLEEYEGIKLLDDKFISVKPEDNSKEITELKEKYESTEKEKINLSAHSNLTHEKEKELDKELKAIRKEIKVLEEAKQESSNEISFFPKESERKAVELRVLHDKFFNTYDKKEKDEIKDKIHKLELEVITAALKEQNKIQALIELEKYERTNTRPYFLWKLHFNEVFHEKGGFDVVLGNPPYVNIINLSEKERKLYKNKFKITKNKVDLYAYFIESSENIINSNSILSFIIPHTWKATDSFSKFREFVFLKFKLNKIVNLDFNTFEATVKPLIILMTKNNFKEKYKIDILNKDFLLQQKIDVAEIYNSSSYIIDTESSAIDKQLFNKIEHNCVLLNTVLQFTRGIKTSNDSRFIYKEKKNTDCKKVFGGKNIKAFFLDWHGEYIWYRPDLMREKVGCLPHTRELFEASEKLITQRVNSSMQLLVAYDSNGYYFLDTANVSKLDTLNSNYKLKFILAIMNSKLINYWYSNKYRMPTIGLYELHSIPVKPIAQAKQQPFITLVDNILSLTQSDDYLHNPDKQVQVKNYEAQIDQLVYKLYGLTEEEIKIVEGKQ